MADHTFPAGGELGGKAVAFLTSNRAVPAAQLLVPWRAVEEAGGRAVLIAPLADALSLEGPGSAPEVGALLDEVDGSRFAGILVPGGRENVEALVGLDSAAALVRAFFATGRPVAAILEGTSLLLASGGLRGQVLTGSTALRDEVMKGRSTWVDRPVVVDQGLITCGDEAHLEGFAAAVVVAFASEAPAHPTGDMARSADSAGGETR